MSKDMELVFQLKFQAKMLEKQAQKESKNAMKERNMAKRFLQKGDRSLAALHAQNSTRASQLSQFFAEQSAKVTGMVCDIRMAQAQKGTAKMLEVACKEMEKSIGTMNLEKIAAVALKYDGLRGKVDQVNQLACPTEETVATGSDLLLADLENELEKESELQLPDVPIASEPVKEGRVAAAMT